MNLAQLLDFESSLVLAKTFDSDTRTAIGGFIRQFRWVRETNTALACLPGDRAECSCAKLPASLDSSLPI